MNPTMNPPSQTEFKTALKESRDQLLEEGCPSTWDINNGQCEEFASLIFDRFGGESDDLCGYWFDELADRDEPEPPGHYVICFKGRYYDAECIEGVDDWRRIPAYQNRGRTRDEVLAERGK